MWWIREAGKLWFSVSLTIREVNLPIREESPHTGGNWCWLWDRKGDGEGLLVVTNISSTLLHLRQSIAPFEAVHCSIWGSPLLHLRQCMAGLGSNTIPIPLIIWKTIPILLIERISIPIPFCLAPEGLRDIGITFSVCLSVCVMSGKC